MAQVNLRHIADRIGVSRMTVSLALRGKPGVAKATREKILKVAEELGYQPDPEVAKLLTRIRAKSIETRSGLALLTSGSGPGEWKRSVTDRKYVEAVQERIKGYGYRLEEVWIHDPSIPQQRLGNVIWHRGVEGVIFAPRHTLTDEGADTSLDINLERLAAAGISEWVKFPGLDRVLHDHYGSMLKALCELTALGYRNPGFVVDQATNLRVNGKWTGAYLQFQLGAEEMTAPPLLVGGNAKNAFNEWFDRYRPDAIVSVAQTGIELMDAKGLEMPAEIGYASLDLDRDQNGPMQYSGIDQHYKMMGAAAVDLVVASIQRGRRGLQEHVLNMETVGSWKAGESTRPQM